MKHLGLKVVIEGKQDNGKPCIYVGIGLGITEQMLLSSVRKYIIHESEGVASW